MDFDCNLNTEFFFCDCFEVCPAFHMEMTLIVKPYSTIIGSFREIWPRYHYFVIVFLGFDFFFKSEYNKHDDTQTAEYS